MRFRRARRRVVVVVGRILTFCCLRGMCGWLGVLEGRDEDGAGWGEWRLSWGLERLCVSWLFELGGLVPWLGIMGVVVGFG